MGVVNARATDIPDSTILADMFARVGLHGAEESYAIKRSSDFVNEYPRRSDAGHLIDGGHENPNHLLGSFPDLWPYGKGGPETDRPIKVSYESHADWAMQYEDTRFSKHLQYMFQVFGVIQKRQVSTSSSLQISRRDFVNNEVAIRSLKPSDLQHAASEESRKVPFSNPAVCALRKHVSAVRAKVMGTDESRIKIRRQIWSTIVGRGPPSLWITINPSDTNDPIAQVLAGTEIDLDDFCAASGPTANERSHMIASDPHAASEFFHLIITTVIEELFGIKGYSLKNKKVNRKEGIFGKVASYIGTVEAQGRGTLHLHIILWLIGAPTAYRMKELLQTEDFRIRVADFIKVNIKADIEEGHGGELIKDRRESSVSYSRPLDPRIDGYSDAKRLIERKLVRAIQLHQCSLEACMVMRRNRLQCKRRAPFDLSTRDWIDEDGTWGPKRSNAYVNNWNPPILHCTCSNHDVKLISNGVETKDIGFYITNYVAKKQKESSNISALFAKRLAFHKAQEKYTVDVVKLNKRLMQRCANTLSREQEFSGPEVASYLRSRGDRYISDFFVLVYLDSFRWALTREFPELLKEKR